MKIHQWNRFAPSYCVAVLMLAGCGGSQPPDRRAGRNPGKLRHRNARRVGTFASIATTREASFAPLHLSR